MQHASVPSSAALPSPQVEPFQRSLADLDVDVMINGRRRDHGFERAHLEVGMLRRRPD